MQSHLSDDVGDGRDGGLNHPADGDHDDAIDKEFGYTACQAPSLNGDAVIALSKTILTENMEMTTAQPQDHCIKASQGKAATGPETSYSSRTQLFSKEVQLSRLKASHVVPK
eukprot:2234680-Amphidinium_carterae.1